MSSSATNPVWLSFPRWLEESGLPFQLTNECQPSAWLVFRRLVELDCEQNLTPDDFLVPHEAMARWTGLTVEEVKYILQQLEEGGWIGIQQSTDVDAVCRISSPLPVPNTEAVIRDRLQTAGVQSSKIMLRYFNDMGELNRVQKVIYLYQMIFGLKFTPRIVEDLEEIANTYDMAVIYDVFSEAHSRHSKSLSWIKSQLGKKI